MANTTSVVPYDKASRKIRPENLCEIIPPLDYSFMKITNVDEVESEEPRIVSPRKIPVQKKVEEDSQEKSNSLCLKLNNNEMKDVTNIMAIASSLFLSPQNLGWIDLSYNVLSRIDPVLTQFENLRILYLHGNCITDLKEVNKLASIPKLWKLSLYANPVEDIKGYRCYCLSNLTNLTSFDFSRITKADRATASTWKKFNTPHRAKKDNKDD